MFILFETQRTSMYSFVLQCPQQLWRAGRQSEAKSLKLSLGLPPGLQYLSHYQLLSRVHVSRKLELELRDMNFSTQIQDMGVPSSIFTTLPNTHPPTVIVHFFKKPVTARISTAISGCIQVYIGAHKRKPFIF